MTPQERVVYKHSHYENKKNEESQRAFQTRYRWLASDEPSGSRGWHCKFCLGAIVKAGDKLSTTGYGYTASVGDASRALVPIPAEHKLKTHEMKEQHVNNAKEAAVEGD